ncbi:hypothetical protein [Photorhabdus hainanensis]|uniref:hypothetical protein n=1 Tax=Photorhabdus hainanensis TaxID=1004166 RepID=UPI001BD25FD2|nr:hypothetical protein [Photorhabdus hainanensis]MBS9434845.1 hypothetical protein [Photorhabdus hainanensis]
MKKIYAKAFSEQLAREFLNLRSAMERKDKDSAYLHYAMTMGMISGATLSGGMSSNAGLDFINTLEEIRHAFIETFHESLDLPADLNE